MLNLFKPPISLKKWIGIAFLLLIFWLILLTFLYAPTLIRSIFLKDLYLDKLKFEQTDIYVNPAMNKEERQNIIILYKKSRIRIDSLFGSSRARPSILVGTTNEVMQRFGNSNAQGQTGMTHLTPFGTYIILSPEGTNIDVLSHELSHAELIERLGWQTRRNKIPIWFDEGLAMLVDKRFEYWTTLQQDWRNLIDIEKNDSNINSNSDFYSTTPLDSDSLSLSSFELQNLQTTEQFFTENAQIHYFLSQEEVARWYTEKGQKGLLQLIENLKENSFEDSYNVEKSTQ
ncbi:DUF1570 domain-containing protein [Bernardetia sp. MNP-M8]|uniref:DUF1570 domain-containing protein n=1 Tax=Bernardetia sp. MNP-M8 TaxID=3127470 RepID=UPI0030CFA634